MTAPADLHQFLDILRRAGELTEVDAEVDPRLEVAEIHRRVIAADGPALLFRRTKNSDFPIATNLFGSRRRLELAFGDPSVWVEKAVSLLQGSMPPALSDLWQRRDLVRRLLSLGIKTRSNAAVAEVSGEPRLSGLPALTTWPEDGGPFLTWPNILTEPPGGGPPNLGVYRMQVYDDSTTGMHWQIGKGGGYHLAQAAERGEKLPVTAFLGGPPAMILSAVAPLPENVPEVLLASLVLGGKLPVWRPPVGHPVPAAADFCLVGTVDPSESRAEGPFGDHYGYYSLEHEFPVFRVDRMYHRKNAVFPATVVGKPRQEDFYLGDLLQEILSPIFPVVMPGVRDLWSYGETGYHSLAAAVVRDRYQREALASGFRILGEGQLSLTKFLLLLDRPQDLRQFRSVLEDLLARTDPCTDLFVFGNTSMDTLDYAGPRINHGSKALWAGVGERVRELPARFSGGLPQGTEKAEVFCPGCLVIEGASKAQAPDLARQVAAFSSLAEWPLIVLTEDVERAVASEANFLWTTFTRLDPAQDLHAGSANIVNNHIAYELPIVLDARLPVGFPDELFADEETSELVSRRWNEYFPDGQEMGDAAHGHLQPS